MYPNLSERMVEANAVVDDDVGWMLEEHQKEEIGIITGVLRRQVRLCKAALTSVKE